MGGGDIHAVQALDRARPGRGANGRGGGRKREKGAAGGSGSGSGSIRRSVAESIAGEFRSLVRTLRERISLLEDAKGQAARVR